MSPRCEPWLPLYRVWGQGLLQREGSLDREVESPREVLANLACKLRLLLVFAKAWLSSWSCGHVAPGADMVLLCWPWQHCSHSDGSSAVLSNTTPIVVFAVVSRFPRVSYPWWVATLGHRSLGLLVGMRAATPTIGVGALRQPGRSLVETLDMDPIP
jgi:hypothetical protein